MKKISTFSDVIVALTEGEVWAWGYGGFGEMGNGTTIANNPTPVQVFGVGGTGYINNVIDISAGLHFIVALKSDGTVWTWGNNNRGQLGNGTIGGFSNTPVQVLGLPSNIISIASGDEHAIALTSDGKVYSRGSGQYGQMGNGTIISQNPVPILVNDLGYPFGNKIKQISGGYRYTLALS